MTGVLDGPTRAEREDSEDELYLEASVQNPIFVSVGSLWGCWELDSGPGLKLELELELPGQLRWPW